MAQQEQQETTNRYIETIQSYLQDLQYGTVTLIVQDSKLVRVERLEKFKIDG